MYAIAVKAFVKGFTWQGIALVTTVFTLPQMIVSCFIHKWHEMKLCIFFVATANFILPLKLWERKMPQKVRNILANV